MVQMTDSSDDLCNATVEPACGSKVCYKNRLHNHSITVMLEHNTDSVSREGVDVSAEVSF